METRKVVGILTKPRDWQWSEEEIQLTGEVFFLGPSKFIAKITERECLILAAFWREQASRKPAKAKSRLCVAHSFERLATLSWKEETRMRWSRYG